MFRFLFRWSLEITGSAMVGFSLLDEHRQKQIIAAYGALRNSARLLPVVATSAYEYSQAIKTHSQSSAPNPERINQVQTRLTQVHQKIAQRLAQVCQTNQGVYLKFGLYLGHFTGAIPWQYSQVFSKLDDTGTPISYPQIKQVIEKDLQLQIKNIYSKFKRAPNATRSVYQVHTATLAEYNKQVAVKVQYPYLRLQKKYDLWALRQVGRLVNAYIGTGINLEQLVDELDVQLSQELDFEREIANAAHARIKFKGDRAFRVPKIYPEYSSERVLVTEYVEGPNIGEVDKIREMGLDPRKVARQWLRIYSDMVMKHGFINNNLSDENVKIRPKRNRKGEFDIVVLGHGFYRYFDEQFTQNYRYLWQSLMNLNRGSILKSANTLGVSQHYPYLPVLFLHRTPSSTSRLGAPLTAEQLSQSGLLPYPQCLEQLPGFPGDLLALVDANEAVNRQNQRLGGGYRGWLLEQSRASGGVAGLRVWLYENAAWLHRLLFGAL